MRFKFCPVCGCNLREIESDLLVCNICGFNFYQNSKPTVSVILVDKNDKVLLVKRGIEPKKGTWDLPGGFVREGETFEEGIRREAFEELQAGVGELKYLRSYSDKYLYQAINFMVLSVAYVCKYDGKIVTGDDVEEAAWFAREDIPWGDFGFESMKKCLEDYYRI